MTELQQETGKILAFAKKGYGVQTDSNGQCAITEAPGSNRLVTMLYVGERSYGIVDGFLWRINLKTDAFRQFKITN